ncbi:Clo7bot family Cys-rich peptide [Paenibacillus tianjinensis]|uniref:Clo7bot family Cys-rich peptide n=1 Tax=Paenibacillus tianjinensis TaxID=2810347 RepID=A0ABX7LB33_9BACL|nr:Clo7bot family Cys-rich peptide [Paenibacillus tianjinensis]
MRYVVKPTKKDTLGYCLCSQCDHCDQCSSKCGSYKNNCLGYTVFV